MNVKDIQAAMSDTTASITKLSKTVTVTIRTIPMPAQGRHKAPFDFYSYVSRFWRGIVAIAAVVGLAAFALVYQLTGNSPKAITKAAPAVDGWATAAEHSAPAAIVPDPVHQQLIAAAIPVRYRIRVGDTLSSIARSQYGSATMWPSLWWVNKGKVHNPNAITAGVWLTLSGWHPVRPWISRAALAAIPAPPPPPVAPWTPVGNGSAGLSAPPPPLGNPPVASPAFSGAPGSYQACVIARESGGNASAVNASSGAGGLYQFLPSTWASLGYSGLPQNASVADQNAAFQKLYAQQGTSPWSPSDGC